MEKRLITFQPLKSQDFLLTTEKTLGKQFLLEGKFYVLATHLLAFEDESAEISLSFDNASLLSDVAQDNVQDVVTFQIYFSFHRTTPNLGDCGGVLFTRRVFTHRRFTSFLLSSRFDNIDLLERYSVSHRHKINPRLFSPHNRALGDYQSLTVDRAFVVKVLGDVVSMGDPFFEFDEEGGIFIFKESLMRRHSDVSRAYTDLSFISPPHLLLSESPTVWPRLGEVFPVRRRDSRG